jgi:hypothetical protein
MLAWEADVDKDARHIQVRVRLEEGERRRRTVNVARFTVQEAGPHPAIPGAGQRPLNANHFASRALVGVVPAIILAVAPTRMVD